MFLAALLFPLLVQGPPAPPATQGAAAETPEEVPGRFPVNRLDLIVNDRCLTRRDVWREIGRLPPPATPEERSAMVNEIFNARVEEFLMTQAGKDLGFDEGMVKRLVESEIERREERAGSISLLGDQLIDSNLDSGTYYESTESMMLAELWKRSVDGRFAGPGGRPYVDRFVRPGRLLLEYERNKGLLALPTTVVLQELAIDAQQLGDLREAKDLAEDLRQRILLGEDFGEVALSARAAPPDTKGVLPPFEEERLQGIPGLAEFLAEAQPGDLSEVLPVRSPEGVLRGFRVVRLLERNRPEPPSFQDQAFQQDLTERIQESVADGRTKVALGELQRAAYVWPPEAFGRQVPAE